ncbi:hypothetical protein [Geothrix sp. 21YS21S-2]|uniref:hypothetical protein n=1 Tax=Geothrix sp. 21YS21S-2 TaxID=3068893 RepID=UPI0027BAFF09|nr:hypothetical protein [Geothrix sp. 21YS21S-2]
MRNTRNTLVALAFALSPITAFAMPDMFKHATAMNVSPEIPAAKGEVKFGRTDDGNISIHLSVRYLADPQKLRPPAATYVVWVSRDKDSPAQNVGALKTEKDREGKIKTVTPFKAFQLFVTAEANGEVQAPMGTRLLWIDYNSD